MNSLKRLSSLADVTGAALRPAYDPARHGHGIVHLGIGAFHRAHQAHYTTPRSRLRGAIGGSSVRACAASSWPMP